jgi:hypothetical protein
MIRLLCHGNTKRRTEYYVNNICQWEQMSAEGLSASMLRSFYPFESQWQDDEWRHLRLVGEAQATNG